jgi:hypothetical protein
MKSSVLHTIVGPRSLVPDAYGVALLRHDRVAVTRAQDLTRQVHYAAVLQDLDLVVDRPKGGALVDQAVLLNAEGIDLDDGHGGRAALEAGDVHDVAVGLERHHVGLLFVRAFVVPDDAAVLVVGGQPQEA